MTRNKRIWTSVAAVFVLGAAVFAHVRLQHPTFLTDLYWPTPNNISIVINQTGSDDISNGSHIPAVRNAIDEWNKQTGTTVQLVENTDPAQMARTDWDQTDIHLVYFDETNESGFFGGSGTVAVTPVWFFSNGQISDADILYNGGDFGFTTDGTPGFYDVQDVGTHELGHLIGFDHSGWAGATMYPFVDPTVILHRSLSTDDIMALRDAYPDSTFAAITGFVRRQSDNTPVAGAHVVARDNATGRPVAATITDATGAFSLGGLDAGTYDVYANPLDEPVDSGNFGGGHTFETDFEATMHGTSQVVTAGNTTNLGDLLVGADVTPVFGHDGDPFPFRAPAGVITPLVIRGTNLVPGSTLTASDPSITLNNVVFTSNQVMFNCDVSAMEEFGHFDLTASSPGGDDSILTAAIEVTPADPTVGLVSPNTGSDAGGTNLTLTGTGFRAGCRVVIGDTIYVDGQPGGLTVVSPTSITLTTAPMVGGNHDVVVIDETGVEGRLATGFQSLSVPTVTASFPAAGDVAGGTRMVLTGTNFATDAVVRINGVAQTPGNITWIDTTRLELTTDAAAAGGPYDIQVENPGPSVANFASAFTFVAKADPTVTNVAPDTAAAGTTVTVTGTNFDATTEIFFGAADNTGMGGVMGDNHMFINATTIEVDVPVGLTAGMNTVMANDPGTGQGFILPGAVSIPGGGSSGGGCFTREVSANPFDPASMMAGGAWALLVLAALGLNLALKRRRRSTMGA